MIPANLKSEMFARQSSPHSSTHPTQRYSSQSLNYEEKSTNSQIDSSLFRSQLLNINFNQYLQLLNNIACLNSLQNLAYKINESNESLFASPTMCQNPLPFVNITNNIANYNKQTKQNQAISDQTNNLLSQLLLNNIQQGICFKGQPSEDTTKASHHTNLIPQGSQVGQIDEENEDQQGICLFLT